MNRTSLHFISLILICIVIGSCKKPSDDLTIIFNTSSLFKSPLMVRFDDASALADFNVTITGKDSALVQMGSGSKVFKAVGGLLPLALKAQAKPTPNNPLTFIINADIPGYTTVKKTIIISNDSASVYTIPITKYVKPIDGTAELTFEMILNAGKTTNLGSFTTSTNSKLNEVVNINVAADNEMQNSSKALINANLLTAKVVVYGTSLTSLNAIFPGHGNTMNAISKDGKRILWGLNFVTAGLLRVTATAGTTTVGNFAKPLAITQELPVNFNNPKTGSLLKAGDLIPLWIYDGSTGTSKETTNFATVITQGAKLAASYTIATPGTWNLAFTSSPVASQVNKSFSINLLPMITPFTGTYNLLFQNASGINLMEFLTYQPQTHFFREGTLVNGNIVYSTVSGKYGYGLPQVPNVSSAKVVLYNQSGQKIGETPLFNPLTASQAAITIDNRPVVVVPPTPVPPIEYLNISVDLSGKCTNKSIVSPLNSWVTINNVTNKTNNFFYVKNGKIDNATASIKVILGHQYTISITYDGVTQTSEPFKAEKSDSAVQLSSVFNGKTTYTASSNTLTISGILSQECK